MPQHLLGRRLRRGLLNHGKNSGVPRDPPTRYFNASPALLVLKGDELDAIQQRRMMEMMGGQAGGVSEHCMGSSGQSGAVRAAV